MTLKTGRNDPSELRSRGADEELPVKSIPAETAWSTAVVGANVHTTNRSCLHSYE